MGDVKLAAPLGLYLGYLGWSQLFYGGALAFVAGGIASVILVLKNRGNKPKEVAYGPSMLAAGLAIILLLRNTSHCRISAPISKQRYQYK